MAQSTMCADKHSPEIMSPRRICILSHPRTTSSLLMRILNLPAQEKVAHTEEYHYFFLPALEHARSLNLFKKPPTQWTDAEKGDLKRTYQRCFDDLESLAASATRKDETVIIKEQCIFMIDPLARSKLTQGQSQNTQEELPFKVQVPSSYNQPLPTLLPANVTVLPDEFLSTWFPVFVIRHPVLAFPSYYRTFMDTKNPGGASMQEFENQLDSVMTYKWTRSLYDWFSELWERLGNTNTPRPVVLDSDDILSADNDVLVRFCTTVGLDARKLRFQWNPSGEEEVGRLSALDRRMKSTLLGSSGVLEKETGRGVCVDAEVKKWNGEFGDAVARKLQQWVDAALPDYEYLRGKRLS